MHNTESSLACPDWPLCYGQFFPKMEGGVLIEHSHRLLASLVGFLTIILVVLTHKERKKGKGEEHAYNISLLSLAFVIIQGILGGITVIYKLPTIVSTFHLGLSMVFFSTLIYLGNQLRKLEDPESFDEGLLIKLRNNWDPNITNGVFISAFLIYIQIVLGAFMRHAGAGMSCGAGFSNSLFCMEANSWLLTLWPKLPQAQLHMTHRFMAVLVTFATTYYSFKSFFYLQLIPHQKLKSYQIYPLLTILVILTQVVLGVVTVGMSLHRIPTTLHLGFAALTLGFLWKYFLRLKDLEEHTYPDGIYTYLGDIVDLTKPRLSALVMSTAFIGILIAPVSVNFFKALLAMFLIWLVVMGAASLNCYLEREVDKLMDRTKNRPLPAGRLSSRTALIFGLVLLGVSLPLLFLTVNIATGFLGLLATLIYLFAYTPLKKKSEMAVYVGAIPGAIPPIMGWTAVMGTLDLMAWLLFLILFIWQLPHFLAISIYHSKDYDAADIKIYPTLKGMPLTKSLIFIFTLFLSVAAILPSYYKLTSSTYSIAAALLGLSFILLAGYGYFLKNSEEVLKSWARKYFLASIFYLPLLLFSMIFLK